ncbi:MULTISPECIES: SdpI family protein [unclassified Saccharopolyspora]|uniref:SdpI family protein n=1 Tax=unclassified Saccharopolyspora TaxID=2646250 RepID=UPI001CD4B7EF|nr:MULTISPECIES: SdpI family protein [unclassified Saccharopolyspora]MCA1185304.1 SdpI family protein [Saccharopolyspora sp. 6T]MCA1195064.1 SdpI family protein [Saccharopolyspora sp. 6V]MCA1281831.1 SdpI family protein [Saccharopolyspora sp. 7B]
MPDAAALALYAVTLVFTGWAMHLIQRLSSRGTLRRNHFVGIRTRATQASDAAWAAGHRAAEPRLLQAARTGYAAGLLTAVITIAHVQGVLPLPVALVAPNAGLVLLLVFALHGTVLANRAARAADGD